MRSNSEHEQSDHNQPDDYRELRLLTAVEDNPKVTQRQLSTQLGMALGLTNVMLRSLAQKGYMRATQAGWKRWVYALTPDGFSHKLRLTLSYISRTLSHYKTVRQMLKEQMELLDLNNESRIAMLGTGEFAELVYLGLREIGVDEITFFGAEPASGQLFLGKPVDDISALKVEEYDHVVVASLGNTQPYLSSIKGLKATPDKLVTLFKGLSTEVKE